MSPNGPYNKGLFPRVVLLRSGGMVKSFSDSSLALKGDYEALEPFFFVSWPVS